MANVLPAAKRVQIVSALIEGCSIRSTARMVGVSRNTVTKLLLDLAEVCQRHSDEHFRDLPCRRLQVDEIWSFVYAKAKNVPAERQGEFGVGDVWTFTAIDAETKLVPSWLVGSRDTGCATELLQDLAGRLRAGRSSPPTVTDVPGGDGSGVRLRPRLRHAPEDLRRRPGAGDALQPRRVHRLQGGDDSGRPGPRPRLDLLRRAPEPHHADEHAAVHPADQRISKKVENHAAAVAVHFFFYNWCRPHLSLRTERDNRVTPAMAAGIARRPWTVAEMVGLLNPEN